MLRLGKSKPWKEVMEIMTGTPNMDTGAYREYFAPLEKWLIKKNKEEKNKVGLCSRF
jgi:peptidyl-dipeptidase A